MALAMRGSRNNGNTTPEISKKLHVSVKTIIQYLHRGNDINLCKYNGLNKEVICTTTGEVFPSIKLANQKYNTIKVGNCCRGEKDYIIDNNGKKLTWMFYKKYFESIAS